MRLRWPGKLKILSLSSSPKGYNIDKTLKALSNSNAVVAFVFSGRRCWRRCSSRVQCVGWSSQSLVAGGEKLGIPTVLE